MRTAVLALLVCLCACDHTPADNDRIIRETKKCRDAGLKATLSEWGDIWCIPVETK